jgi:hypothetical protein
MVREHIVIVSKYHAFMPLTSFFKKARFALGGLTIFLFLGISPAHEVAAAGSGACSSHGGVDCSAGADYDGSVICEDGWRHSSVSYRSVEKCKEDSSVRTCTAPDSIGCKSYFDYLQLKNALSVGPNDVEGKTASDQLALCRIEIQLFFERGKLYNYCLELQNAEMTVMSSLDSDLGCWSALGIHSKRGPSPGTCVCDSGYVFNKSADTCILDLGDKRAEVDAAILSGYAVASGPVERTAEGKCPDFSSVRGNDAFCSCNDGFFGVLSTCTVAPVYCSIRYGSAAEWDAYKKSCSCKTGYGFDPARGSCISLFEECTQRLGVQAVLSSGRCVCNEGAALDPVTGKCESKLVIEARGTQSSVAPRINTSSSSPATGGESASVPPKAAASTPRYFIGKPKSKQDLLNCSIVGVTANKRYYMRGHASIKSMTISGKECFATEAAAKLKRYVRVK